MMDYSPQKKRKQFKAIYLRLNTIQYEMQVMQLCVVFIVKVLKAFFPG